jgi:hypothetical protein
MSKLTLLLPMELQLEQDPFWVCFLFASSPSVSEFLQDPAFLFRERLLLNLKTLG